MEFIRNIFLGYLHLLSTWWWIGVSILSFFMVIVTALRNNDGSLTMIKALQLVCVGLASFLPFIETRIPFKPRIDFVTRWYLLELGPFGSFVLVNASVSFLLGPLFFCIVISSIIYDSYLKTTLASDMSHHGLIKTIKLRFLGR